MNADPNYQIYRRFGLLRTWALLDLQHDLSTLEKRFKDNPEDIQDKGLMAETRTKLEAYDDLTKQQSRFMSLDQPDIQNHVELLSWAGQSGFRDSADLRYNWLYHRDDLAILAPDGENARVSMFESFLLKLMILVLPPEFIKRVFMNEYERKLTANLQGVSGVWIGSDHLLGIRRFVQFTIIAVGLTLSLYPIAMLYFHVTDWGKWSKIGLIIGFTSLFALFLRVFTKVKTQELLNYLSGYSALLIVFLGLSS